MSLVEGDCIILQRYYEFKPKYIGEWELGRQDALYTKRLVHIPYSILSEVNSRFYSYRALDAWHLKINGDIPRHRDPIDLIMHYRFNVHTKGSCWFNLDRKSYFLEAGDVIIFRSDLSFHGLEIFEKNPVEIFSVGIFIERDVS